MRQLDGTTAAAEQAAARTATGDAPVSTTAGLFNAARVSHNSTELDDDRAEDAAAEALQVQIEQIEQPQIQT